MVLDLIGGRSIPESVIGPSLRLTYVRQLRLKSLIDDLADLGKLGERHCIPGPQSKGLVDFRFPNSTVWVYLNIEGPV